MLVEDRLFDNAPFVGVVKPLFERRLHDAQITRDHLKAFEESRVVLASAKLGSAREAALRRELTVDTAGYLIKGLEPEKARRFLAGSGLARDAGYCSLYAAACAPRPVLAALRAARAAFLRTGVSAPGSRGEYAAVEALVRPLLQ